MSIRGYALCPSMHGGTEENRDEKNYIKRNV